MRYKRARSLGELGAIVGKEMPTLSDPEKLAEAAKRFEAVQSAGAAIEQWDLTDLSADLNWCGLAGSPTKVHRVQSIVLTKEGFSAVEPTQEAVSKMIHELIVDRTLASPRNFWLLASGFHPLNYGRNS